MIKLKDHIDLAELETKGFKPKKDMIGTITEYILQTSFDERPLNEQNPCMNDYIIVRCSDRLIFTRSEHKDFEWLDFIYHLSIAGLVEVVKDE